MNISRIGILLLGVLLAALILGCNALALGGAQKYKVDLTNILMKIQDEIENEGKVSDQTFNKFENFMESNEEEFGNKGSYVKAEEVMKCLVEARNNPANAFMQLQSAKVEMTLVFDMLKTEVSE
ncbi:MAG TPA: hypothetical protein ENO21_03905 [Firmicutes bacterium]|nr:hypothetical protein [Bacillota bacterium]